MRAKQVAVDATYLSPTSFYPLGSSSRDV